MSDIKSQLLAISDSSEWEEHPFGKVAFQGAAEIARLRSALSTAREEGKKEGLEEAANAVAEKLELAFLDKLDTQISGPYRVGLNAALEAIRALKEKQP